MKRYLVTGASGTVGSRLVALLKAQGAPVRATTSKRENAGSRDGAEWAYVDLSSGEGLREAFEGIDRAFLLSPPGYADQYRILAPLVSEARRRKLEKVVLMSAMGANADDNAPLPGGDRAREIRPGLQHRAGPQAGVAAGKGRLIPASSSRTQS
jgi:uncharacterized protein YbjT (DUF2867 family)